MKKVYVVTSGEYSDYSIEAVFTIREKAETFSKHISYDPCVEEYELDPIDRWGPITKLTMDRNGDSWGDWTDESVHDPQTKHELRRISINGQMQTVLHSRVATDDVNRARKVANEARTQLIASGKWDSFYKRKQ